MLSWVGVRGEVCLPDLDDFFLFLLWLVQVSFAFTYLLVLGICDHSLTFITPPHCMCV